MASRPLQQTADLCPPQANSIYYTPRHAAAGLRWLFERRKRWDLSMDELGVLLGGVGRRTLTEWQKKVRTGEDIEVPRDVMERISLLLGIHKGLVLITPDNHEGMAYDWFKQPLELIGLQGQSMRDYLLTQGSMDALYYLRRNIDAMRG